jgi:hypothetical protein
VSGETPGIWAQLTCGLCGITDPDVRPSFVRWAKAHVAELGLFQDMPRCLDRDACRARLEAKGGTWRVAPRNEENAESFERGLDRPPPAIQRRRRRSPAGARP